MEESTKYLLTQGVLGLVCLVEGIIIRYLWRDNRTLVERLVIKSEKDSEKNKELASESVSAVSAMSKKISYRRKDTKTKLEVSSNE